MMSIDELKAGARDDLERLAIECAYELGALKGIQEVNDVIKRQQEKIMEVLADD